MVFEIRAGRRLRLARRARARWARIKRHQCILRHVNILNERDIMIEKFYLRLSPRHNLKRARFHRREGRPKQIGSRSSNLAWSSTNRPIRESLEATSTFHVVEKG